MNTHILKSKSVFFHHLIDGNFFHSELRNSIDRDFQEADQIQFIEIDSRNQVTGRIAKASIHKVKKNPTERKSWIFPEGYVLIEFFVYDIIQ
jgi:hypothetical protein